ncbi:MAG: hypothetical protein M3Y79_03520 [Pseudomonadota bacterium]|nr:hypothetical protein [Pseudomonadota bacterium]
MKGKMKTLLLTAAVGAMMTMAAGAMAQAPGGGPPRGGPGAGGPGMGGGMGGMPANDRAGTIQRFGLNDPALKLTAAQTAELDKAADAYVAEIAKVPAGAGGPPSQEAMAARTKARDNLTAAVNKVLNADQKKTWEAAQAAQAQRRGGMGGPGGGMGGPGGPPGGGPGGARPPGQ